MYDFIRGKVVELAAGYAVLDVNGIGFHISVPVSLVGRGRGKGEEMVLYTSLVIREQSHTLFGFLEKEERALFEKLIAISGIGPKTALNLIGHLGLKGLSDAVATSRSSALTAVPGIGKKTAERLLIELKGKVVHLAHGGGPSSEALQALLTLGYDEHQAHRAVHLAEEALGESADLSTLISTALRLSKAPVS